MKRPSLRRPAWPRPATATVVVLLAVLLVTAVVVLAVGFGTDGARAIAVGDETVSRESVNDELEVWADFQPDQFRTTAGAVDARFGAQVVTQVVYELLAQGYLERAGERVTASDRADARAGLDGPRFDDLPGWFQDRYVERLATFQALTRLEGDPDDADAELRVLRREARRLGVTVDPVYGRWSGARVAVVPTAAALGPAPGA